MKNFVLIVEDSRAFALSVEQAIRDETDFDVLLAFDYATACELLDIHQEEIFIAITDLTLPDAEDGAAAKLMSDRHIPCIAFTGNFGNNLREKVTQWGVSDYVLKNGQQAIQDVVHIIQRMHANQNIKTLIVDDAASTRKLISALLKKQCFQVSSVDSASAALKLIETGEQFKILLIDIHMDGMDGFQLLRTLRQQHDVTNMSIIGISGKSSSSDVARFMKYGGNDFLIKPIQQEQLSCRVNSNAQLLDQFENLTKLNQQKNDLLGMAAHDIRGPLGVVLSGCSLLKKEVTSERGKMLATLASDAADDMETLLNQLLDLSAVENASISINKKLFNLSELLEKTIHENQFLADNKLQKIVLEPTLESIWVEADSDRIKEVINNLLSNAIKYSPKGKLIEVRHSRNQKKVRVEVIDEAGGIPENEQTLLFKAFSNISTQPTGGEKSTGLGLAICQRIMHLHHGVIKYKTNQNKGSVFEVVLPHVDTDLQSTPES